MTNPTDNPTDNPPANRPEDSTGPMARPLSVGPVESYSLAYAREIAVMRGAYTRARDAALAAQLDWADQHAETLARARTSAGLPESRLPDAWADEHAEHNAHLVGLRGAQTALDATDAQTAIQARWAREQASEAISRARKSQGYGLGPTAVSSSPSAKSGMTWRHDPEQHGAICPACGVQLHGRNIAGSDTYICACSYRGAALAESLDSPRHVSGRGRRLTPESVGAMGAMGDQNIIHVRGRVHMSGPPSPERRKTRRGKRGGGKRLP